MEKLNWIIKFEKSEYKISVIIQERHCLVDFNSKSHTESNIKNTSKLLSAFNNYFTNVKYYDLQTKYKTNWGGFHALHFKISINQLKNFIIKKHGRLDFNEKTAVEAVLSDNLSILKHLNYSLKCFNLKCILDWYYNKQSYLTLDWFLNYVNIPTKDLQEISLYYSQFLNLDYDKFLLKLSKLK